MTRHESTIVLAAILLIAPVGPVMARAAATTASSTRLFADSRLATFDRISIEIVGHGPDLVFIPGLASSRETWRATAERLRDRYRLHLIQIAGFAGEPARGNADGPVVIPTAEAIDAYIVGQKLSPAVVIGHSLGGTIALWLAEHHPDHLKKILLVDTLPFFATVMMGPGATPDQVRGVAEKIRTGPPQPAEARDRMLAAMVTGPTKRARLADWAKASDPTVVANALADDPGTRPRPGLAAIPTPITLLYPDYLSVGMPAGAADGQYGAAYAAAPHKVLRRVDHSLHFIMLDQPEAFAADLDAFLGS